MQLSNNMAGHVLPDDLTVGQIREFTTDDTPSGWLDCDGSSYTQTQYPALHAAMALDGYPWGGAGVNFLVPNLKGRSPIGSGHGTGLTLRELGDSLGVHEHILGVPEMPVHNHTTMGRAATRDNIVSCVSGTFKVYSSSTTAVYTGPKGDTEAHNNVGPVAITKFMIYAGE